MGASPSLLQDKIAEYERDRDKRIKAYDREREVAVLHVLRSSVTRLNMYVGASATFYAGQNRETLEIRGSASRETGTPRATKAGGHFHSLDLSRILALTV